ncbi:hypothetical protein [Pseudoblastomonas halimionae]|uniref:DUF11 domain-containing protein n=1 Tax=Alteriqipengyuania halimionae TaxID=1926630 RepID=A0A6I4TZ50_9SPHN|nr:hypothetical protein [Alteriqipengyuania halimionae]MXP09119.1 hypothetical protein [Alteriqipengyuania halimionae]
MMKRSSRLLFTVSGVALALTPIPALAGPIGTKAGVDITNTVSVDYKVGGVNQTQLSANDTFKVDRKVDLDVQTLDTGAVSVNPGQLSAVTKFKVTNESNDMLDFLLAGSNQTGDAFNVSNIKVWIDVDNNGVFSATNDAQVSAISGLASGDAVTVFVVSDIASGGVLPTNGQNAVVALTATAASGVSASGSNIAGTGGGGVAAAKGGSGGSALSQTPVSTVNGKASMETVFADAAGISGDAARDGKHSATSSYTVAGADLSVNKLSSVISDPTGGAEPKAIPGAVIEYCIRVTNGSGAATAANIAINDPVPSQLQPAGTVSIRGPVASSSDACSATQSGTGSIAGQNVSGTLPDLAADQEAALVFRATIK